jgi:hypothetical protein
MATPYMTVATLRSRVSTLDNSKYDDADLAEYIAEFESMVEDYRGVAFTPREATETVDIPAGGASRVVLDWPMVRSITSVTIDGVSVAPSVFRLADDGAVEVVDGQSPFSGTSLTVVYQHGYDSPSTTLLRACREYVRIVAVADRSSVPRDIISTTAEGMSTRYSTPDMDHGRVTGYLEVDRLINLQPSHRLTVGVG